MRGSLFAALRLCTTLPASSLAQEAVEREGTVPGLAPPPALGTGEFEDLEGRHHPIQDYRGRIFVLNLWATWCIPCRERMPLLVAVQETSGPRGVQVTGVSTDDPGRRRDGGIGASRGPCVAACLLRPRPLL